MQQEMARAEVIRPQKIAGGLSFRLFGWQLKTMLKTWKEALSNPDALDSFAYWKPPPMNILVDNGLGLEGDCPIHAYPHVQVYPIGKKPMRCHDAVKLEGEEIATPGH